MGNVGFNNNSRFTSSSPNLRHKFAGSGWGSGRGKQVASPDFGDQSYVPRGIAGERVMSSSSSYSTKGTIDHQKVTFRGASACNEKWRVVGSGSGDQIQAGFKDLKVSESSNQGWKPNGTVTSANNAFWPSQNGVTHDTNYSWQNNSVP